jgi:ABC-2 type transport system ATP-binding protein
MASEPVIRVSELGRRFGATTALASVSLAIARGAVYGLVGQNGAGKTTLIKHILGLLKAERGSVRVFGVDPVADPVAVLSRIGYLSEENDLPGWMRVDELMRYTRAFHLTWDDGYAEELRRTFALEPAAKLGSLSRGQKARAGLLIALAHRPELLVLDEHRPASIPSFARTSSAPSSARSPMKAGRCCSRRTCSTRWSRSPTISR